MKNRKFSIIAALLCFIALITVMRLIWFNQSLHTDQPYSEDGAIDLSEAVMDSRSIYTLNGGWAFYPDVLLEPKDLTSYSGKLETALVPGDWPQQKSPADMDKGTYRLKIQVGQNEVPEKYAIKLRRIQTDFSVYVNGELLEETGNSGAAAHSDKSPLLPSILNVSPGEDGVIDLLVTVTRDETSNEGGIIEPVRFGTEKAIARDHITTLSLQIMMAVIIFLHWAYSLILFLLKPQKTEILYFSIASFFAALSVVISDDRALLIWFDWDRETAIPFVFFSYTALSVFFLLFMKKLFSSRQYDRWVGAIIFLSGIYSLFIWFAPLRVVKDWGILLLVVMLLAFSTVAYLCYRLIRKRERDSLFLLFAAVSILSSVVWAGIINNVSFFGEQSSLSFDPNFYPMDLILAFLSFSTYWFIRFFRAGDENIEFAAKLQKEHQSKNQFLANAAYELRNPLHAMINMTDSVKADSQNKLTEESAEHLQMVGTIGRRVSYLVNDLIDLTKMEQAKIELNTEPVDLKPLIQTVSDMQSFIMQEKQLKIEVEVPEGLPKVQGDPNRLIQILDKLLENAAKFTDKGLIKLSARLDGNFVRIDVEDTGVGIGKVELQLIFHPYEQGNNAHGEKRGLGLGLSICKQLIEQHGGTLSVKSVLSEGSVFSFTLPLASEMELNPLPLTEPAVQVKTKQEAQQIEKLASAFEGKAKILAVNDDPLNSAVLKSVLPSRDYHIETVTNPEDVLERIGDGWDLVVADAMMAGMSGYELTEKIRAQYSISELPVLLLTFRDKPEDIYTGFLAGANDCIVKPVDGLELRVRIETLTKLKRSVNERVRMESAWLQAQIRPHFLFNTLNTIASLSEFDTTRMAKMLHAFGQYLRASFDEQNLKPVVSLENEIELLKSYLYIEQERFGTRLEIQWEIEPELQGQLPPLSIQPLVENAVRHGVLKKQGGGRIRIEIKKDGSSIRVEVTDNGVGMSEEKVKEILTKKADEGRGIGLINTDTRLKQLYGAGLHIETEVDKGTKITFKVPYKEVIEV